MKKNKKRNERNHLYLKLYSCNKKNLKAGFLTGIVAIIFAVIASKCGSVFACIFGLLSLFISGGELFSNVLRLMKKGKFHDGILILIAVLVSFFLGQFALAAMAMSLYKIMDVILMYVSGKLGKSMMDAADVLPQYANLVDTDATIRRVDTSSLTRGMKIMVKNGETVPVDSVISDGFSEFDTSNVFLSNSPVSLSAGDKVLGGYLNVGSSVTCEVLCDSENSLSSYMRKMASKAETGSTRSEKRFSSIARCYPIAMLMLAIIVLIVGGFTSGAWTSAMIRACVFLVLATTGSYVMAAPLIRSCAAWNLKKKGLAVASADLIDEMADINCVIFEKEGLLTNGVYEIKEIYTANDVTEEDFLMITANCIGGRQHPISKILSKYMNQYLTTENIMEFPGKGIECTIMGKTFLCGSEQFVKNSGVDIGETTGYTVYVSIDGNLMGALKIQDALKTDTTDSLQVLKESGVEKIILFSSDKAEVAETACVMCGADEYYSDLLPHARAEVIAQMKAKDEDLTCAYIGDVLSGSQAMEAADVGILHVKITDTAIEHSKTALLGDLSSVAEALEMARLACGKIELHFYCATAVKLVLALLALFGAVNIAAAIVIDALLTGVAMFSSLDLIRK